MPVATAQAAQKLLTPNDHTLIMSDHQSQMAFATRSIDLAALRMLQAGAQPMASVQHVLELQRD